MPTTTRWLLAAGLATLLLMWPQVASGFYLQLGVEMLLLTLYATSFNLLFGYGGMLSLGHAAYHGVGAYAVALLVKKLQFTSFFGTLGLAALFAGLAGFVIGYFCVRLSRVYFTMLTLAFAQMLHALASRWYSLTNGDTGIVSLPPAKLTLGAAVLDFGRPANFYYLALIVVAVCMYLLWRVVSSPFGLAVAAMRENAKRAAFLGLPVHRYQHAAFVIAAAFGGVAGGLYAWFQLSVFPDAVHWAKSADAVTVTLMGGPGLFWGPALGAVLLLLLQTLIRRVWEYWALTLGLVLLALVLFLPGGVGGFIDAWLRRAAARAAAARAAGEVSRGG